MLSRVLSGREAAGAQTAVFPLVLPETCRQEKTGAAGHPEIPEHEALRERINQLESRLAAERHESFEAGRKEGEHQAHMAIEPVLDRLNQSIAEIVSLRPELRRRAEKDLVQLALLIAKRVLHRELSVDDGALTAIARVAFERLARAESYRVTVNPRFAPSVNAALPAGLASRIDISPDPECAPGTLIIHASEGIIDASVESQLDEISRGLSDHLARF